MLGWDQLWKLFWTNSFENPLGYVCLLLNCCWLPQFTICLSPKHISRGHIVTNTSHASSMPIKVKVSQYLQPEINRQTCCIKCSCTNLGGQFMWKDTNSCVSVWNILPEEYFGRVFYFTASLTQDIFVLSVTEPDIWIRWVPGSTELSGSWSHLLVTAGWSPEPLLSAAGLH